MKMMNRIAAALALVVCFAGSLAWAASPAERAQDAQQKALLNEQARANKLFDALQLDAGQANQLVAIAQQANQLRIAHEQEIAQVRQQRIVVIKAELASNGAISQETRDGNRAALKEKNDAYRAAMKPLVEQFKAVLRAEQLEALAKRAQERTAGAEEAASSGATGDRRIALALASAGGLQALQTKAAS